MMSCLLLSAILEKKYIIIHVHVREFLVSFSMGLPCFVDAVVAIIILTFLSFM